MLSLGVAVSEKYFDRLCLEFFSGFDAACVSPTSERETNMTPYEDEVKILFARRGRVINLHDDRVAKTNDPPNFRLADRDVMQARLTGICFRLQLFDENCKRWIQITSSSSATASTTLVFSMAGLPIASQTNL
jgi:hypothetical protein